MGFYFLFTEVCIVESLMCIFNLEASVFDQYKREGGRNRFTRERKLTLETQHCFQSLWNP